MTDTMREKFESMIYHEAQDSEFDVGFNEAKRQALLAYEFCISAQADARAEQERARALVGEMLACIEPNGAFDKVIAKAQTFMEGK